MSSSEAFSSGAHRVIREVAGLVVGTWGPARRPANIPLSVVDLLMDGVASEDFACLLSGLKRNGLAYNSCQRKWELFWFPVSVSVKNVFSEFHILKKL